MNTSKVNCIKCKHYFVTWDIQLPKGCKAFGFKSSMTPAIIVLRTSGQACMKFEEKRKSNISN